LIEKKFYNQIVCFYVLGTTANMINFIKILKSKNIYYKVILKKEQIKEKIPELNKNIIDILDEINCDYQILNIKKLSKRQINSKNKFLLNFGSHFDFSKDFIKDNTGKIFNFMPTPLPRYRGGAHVTWAMMKNEKYWGSRIQEIDEKTKKGGFIDNGRIAEKINYKLNYNFKSPNDFIKFTNKKDIKLLKIFLNRILNNKLILKEVMTDESIFFPRLNSKKNSIIDWSWNKKFIVSFINSFSKPYIGAIASLNNKKVYLDMSRICTNEKFHPYQSGLIVNKDNNGFKILTSDGVIEIKNIKNSKGKIINTQVKTGARLKNYNPKKKISYYKENKKYLVKGKKIYLRPLLEKDCNIKYLNWLNNLNVNQFLETRWKKQSIKSIKEFVSQINSSKNNYIFGIISKETNEHIGNIKIGDINFFHKNAEIGYFIGEKKNWGKGFSTEAIKLASDLCFQKLKLKYVKALVYQDNIGSIKALKKNGFSIDGKFINKIVYKNKRRNELSLSKSV
tara:strand:+ start:657 stop:2177 length:1521 start_codon:yes stop_codon:yes gene_type:complete